MPATESRTGDAANSVQAWPSLARVERAVAYGLFLSGPWFLLRTGGAQFDKGTSFYIADLFLGSAILLGLLRVLQTPRAVALRNLWWLQASGSICLAWLLLSLVPGLRASVPAPVSTGPFLSGFIQYGYVLLGIPLASYFLSRTVSLDDAIKALAIGSVLPMIVSLLLIGWWSPPVLKEAFISYGRANGPVGNPNVFAAIICLAMPAYIYLTMQPQRLWRNVGIASAALAISTLVVTVSFSGILVLAVLVACSAAFLATAYRRQFLSTLRQVVIILFAVAIGAAAITTAAVSTSAEARATLSYRFPPLINAMVPNFVADNIPIGRDEAPPADTSLELQDIGSSGIRLELIYRAVNVLQERGWGMLFGHGLRQTYTLPQFQFGDEALDVHLIYLLLWLEAGGVGLALYVGYFGLLAWLASRSAGVEAATRYAALAPVAIFLLIGVFMPHMYLRFLWVPLIPAMMLAVSGKREKRETS